MEIFSSVAEWVKRKCICEISLSLPQKAAHLNANSVLWNLKKNATRQTKHLLKCKKTPDDVREHLQNPHGFVEPLPKPSSNDSSEDDLTFYPQDEASTTLSSSTTYFDKPTSSTENFEKASSSSNKGIKPFFDQMSSNEQMEIDTLFARDVYTSGVSISTMSKPIWKELFKKIRPAYKVPYRYQLTDPFLQIEYNKVKDMVDKEIAAATVLTLQTD